MLPIISDQPNIKKRFFENKDFTKIEKKLKGTFIVDVETTKNILVWEEYITKAM